ncbi:MAG: ribonuclease P protein component [Egibacteraceae bacterium]
MVAWDVPYRAFLSMTPRRLHRSHDIRAVFAARNVAHGRLLTVYAIRRARGSGETPQARAAVVAGRDVGGAVQRNRAKRRLRAALATGALPPGLDLVVRAHPAAIDADFVVLETELGDLIGRAAAKAARVTAKTGEVRG